MPINPDAVGTKGEPGEHSWTSKDAMLYALGVGAGGDRSTSCSSRPRTPTDTPQRVLPTMAVVLGTGGVRRHGDDRHVQLRRCSSTASRPSSCTTRSRSRAR